MNCSFALVCIVVCGGASIWSSAEGGVSGWLNWRGPLQTGAAPAGDYPDDWERDGGNHLWTYPVKGGGTPVIAGGRLYAFGYHDETSEVRETLLCLDAVTGKKLWEHRFSDFISDIIYNRYGIGSPVVDPETGNVYLQASNGRCLAFTGDGRQLWERSLMEEFGRLTFPNGRTGSPSVDGRLVIFHCVTANWGRNGPARDRFYAFDKRSGELVWYSTPGIRPVDSSFSMGVFDELGGHRVFYAGTGCGNVVCVDARTGRPLWRFHLSQGGVNAQVVRLGGDRLIAVHGKENIDATTKGRLVCLRIPTSYPEEQLVLGKEAEVWRNEEHLSFTSSPVLVEDRIYTTIATGELLCTDAESGRTLWRKKLAPDQLHASPAYGDGKLYAPFAHGSFFIVKPGDDGAEVLHKSELDTPCLGAPALWDGRCYLMTRDGLHCFGAKGEAGAETGGENSAMPWNRPQRGEGRAAFGAAPGSASAREVTSLQIVPPEFAISPGGSKSFAVWGLDAHGRRVRQMEDVRWEKFIPPAAKVRSEVDATFQGDTLTAGKDAKISAGAFRASAGGHSATMRGRVVANLGYREDFEGFQLRHRNEAGEEAAFPPLPWLGARVKWHVLERDGSKVIANRLDNILFQRTMNFFGDPSMRDYVAEADVMTDGNRRIMSTVGLVNQRYLVTLVGNAQLLEVSSNHERLKESVKFRIKPRTWYTVKTHVERNADGSGTVRAKAWPRDAGEPADWTIEVPVAHAHAHGAPAVFAFSPQAQKRVYLDNLKLSSP